MAKQHSILDVLKQLAQAKQIRFIDYYFAQFAYEHTNNERIALAACTVSVVAGQGHTCIDFSKLDSVLFIRDDLTKLLNNSQLMDSEFWLTQLKQSDFVGEIDDDKPLILDNNCLYFRRYWQYEQLVIRKIKSIATKKTDELDWKVIRDNLDQLFFADKQSIDWQKISAILCLINHFVIITGGPGTGKTYTALRIIVLLLNYFQKESLSIALTAPTGKAAMRLSTSIQKGISELAITDDIKQLIPNQAITLHRLLGIKPGKASCYYHAENNLPYDVVILDESSMVDLALFAKLLNALKPDARLILLGDSNQLASVDVGSVFFDLGNSKQCNGFSKELVGHFSQHLNIDINVSDDANFLTDNMIILEESKRYQRASDIDLLAQSIIHSNAEKAMSLLRDNRYSSVAFHAIEDPKQQLVNLDLATIFPFLTANSVQEAIHQLSHSQILCALKYGIFGEQTLNQYIEQLLLQQGLIKKSGTCFKGQPIMILVNDYHQNLFNGDTGIIWPDERGNLNAYFKMINGHLKAFAINQLPAFTTSFAITIHKSQGTEYEKVFIILPDIDNPILTHELLYTAVSRASHQVEILGNKTLLPQIINRKTERSSGLNQLLFAE